jgi:hypothetical protein
MCVTVVMNIDDYLIDQAGKDWPNLLADWSTALPPAFTVWLVNRFGDVFAVFDDGSVHKLDVALGTVDRVADSRDHFCEQLDNADKANNWMMIPLVDQCVSAELNLTHDQCYGYRFPPSLGGEYTVENVVPISLREHYSSLADLYRQTKDLPDGTRVKLVVTNLPTGG